MNNVYEIDYFKTLLPLLLKFKNPRISMQVAYADEVRQMAFNWLVLRYSTINMKAIWKPFSKLDSILKNQHCSYNPT